MSKMTLKEDGQDMSVEIDNAGKYAGGYSNMCGEAHRCPGARDPQRLEKYCATEDCWKCDYKRENKEEDNE